MIGFAESRVPDNSSAAWKQWDEMSAYGPIGYVRVRLPGGPAEYKLEATPTASSRGARGRVDASLDGAGDMADAHCAAPPPRESPHGEKGVRRFRTTSQTQLAPLHLAAAQIRRACADISAKAGESTGAQKE